MKRLLEEGSDALTLTVLESAALDTPTDEAMQRAARALGVGALGLAASTASASAWSKLVASASATKLIVVAIVVAVVAATWHAAAPTQRTTMPDRITRAATLPVVPATPSAEPTPAPAPPAHVPVDRPSKKRRRRRRAPTSPRSAPTSRQRARGHSATRWPCSIARATRWRKAAPATRCAPSPASGTNFRTRCSPPRR